MRARVRKKGRKKERRTLREGSIREKERRGVPAVWGFLAPKVIYGGVATQLLLLQLGGWETHGRPKLGIRAAG